MLIRFYVATCIQGAAILAHIPHIEKYNINTRMSDMCGNEHA